MKKSAKDEARGQMLRTIWLKGIWISHCHFYVCNLLVKFEIVSIFLNGEKEHVLEKAKRMRSPEPSKEASL